MSPHAITHFECHYYEIIKLQSEIDNAPNGVYGELEGKHYSQTTISCKNV